MANRVVITGLGPVTPIGTGKNKFWQSLIQGKCGIDMISYFDTKEYPTKIAAELKDFDYSNYISIKKNVKKLKLRSIQLRVGELSDP